MLGAAAGGASYTTAGEASPTVGLRRMILRFVSPQSSSLVRPTAAEAVAQASPCPLHPPPAPVASALVWTFGLRSRTLRKGGSIVATGQKRVVMTWRLCPGGVFPWPPVRLLAGIPALSWRLGAEGDNRSVVEARITRTETYARATGHPVIASAEPGERWLFCYPDDAFAEY